MGEWESEQAMRGMMTKWVIVSFAYQRDHQYAQFLFSFER